MDCEFLIVDSITYAIKAKSILDDFGIPSKTEKIKNVASNGGCGYGIRVSKDVSKIAQRYISASGIKITKIIGCKERRK